MRPLALLVVLLVASCATEPFTSAEATPSVDAPNGPYFMPAVED